MRLCDYYFSNFDGSFSYFDETSAAGMEENHVRVYLGVGVHACVYACVHACAHARETQRPCAFVIITSQILMGHFNILMRSWPLGWGRIMYVCTCAWACVHAPAHYPPSVVRASTQ